MDLGLEVAIPVGSGTARRNTERICQKSAGQMPLLLWVWKQCQFYMKAFWAMKCGRRWSRQFLGLFFKTFHNGPSLSSFINWPEAEDLKNHSGGPGYGRVTSWKESGPLTSVQFSLSVMSDSLPPPWTHHTRPPCPSPTPGVYSNSCPLSRWCHPTISSSVVPFSSFPQSFPASGSFQMSQFSWGAKVLEFQLQDQSFQCIFMADFL